MAWNGTKIKERLKEIGITQETLVKRMKISRVALNNWIKGQIPKGIHLMKLCKELDVGVDFFFEETKKFEISVPRHRTIRNVPVTDTMHSESDKLAMKYEKFFRDALAPGMMRVFRVNDFESADTLSLAKELRDISEIKEDVPMTYKNTFLLLEKLGIITIFRNFPSALKTYTFFCRIHKYKVVFVNYLTNVLDLIFPLLHESVHALLDEDKDNNSQIYNSTLEKFCDNVANYTQFPTAYVLTVKNEIKRKTQEAQIKIIKDFSEKNRHSLFGLAKRLRQFNYNLPSKEIARADTNLKRNFYNIGDILFRSEDSLNFIECLQELSPRFFNIIADKLPYCTVRKFGEWLGLSNEMDANEVKKAFEKHLKLR